MILMLAVLKIILFLIIAYIVIGTLIVCWTFYFAFFCAPRFIFSCEPSTAPFAGRPRPPHLLSAFLKEVPRALVLIAIRPLYPFLGKSFGVRYWKLHPKKALPVVLVHGYMMTRTNWIFFMPMLARRRVPGPYYTFNYNTLSCVKSSAEKLARFVEQIADEWKVERINLVSHSWGGAVSRWYIEQLGGHRRVQRLVELAPTNHGTLSCYYAIGCPGYEGAPGSWAIGQLGPPPEGVSCSVIWSTCDQSIIPPEFALLEPYPSPPTRAVGRSAEYMFDNIGHLTELWYGPVADQAAQFLTSP